MNFTSRLLILLFTLASLTQAQRLVHLDSPSRELKEQNGHFISWEKMSKDKNVSDVNVYSDQGNVLTKISVLRLVPEATAVSIEDVAIAPNGMITVAAVYGREEEALRGSTLLYFNSNGRLLTAITLHPTRQISRLATDEKSNVWTLTITAAQKNPSTVPMLVEYDASGNQVRELLKRSEFPADATENRDDLGLSGFGYENGTVWFWLPASQDFVTVDVNRGSTTKVNTGLPNTAPVETPMGIFRDSKGLLALVIERKGPNQPGTYEFFRWSNSTQNWSRTQPVGCADNQIQSFVGIESGKGFFARYLDDRGLDICASNFK